MKFVSLFSGIGGFDLGFERSGMACLAQVEIDKNCRSLLSSRFPGVEVFEDVRAVGKQNLPATDLICGGFPCQDVSIAGRREGLAGERSGLWFEFARIIEELNPGWVVIENVPGLLSSNGGRDFGVIINKLVKLGYGVVWRVLDAQYFGVPQRRRRVFIVGSLGNGRAAEVLFEREGGTWNPAPSRKAWQRVAGTLDEKSTSSNRGSQGNELDFIAQERMGTGGNNVPLVGVRRLTPTECERLQGFPDGWTDGFSDSTRYRMLGNAVAVPVIEWIGKRIIEAK